jgi:chemotaxis receptor (MCP) glutamine deamidase CheD
VLAEAQRGVYPEAEAEEIPDTLRKRFLTRVEQGFQIQPQVASLVTFAQANLIAEPFPIRGRFDVIFCRNVMIYFDHTIQQRLVREFVARLPPSGYLVIGHSESMVAHHLPRMNETVGVYRPPGGSSAEVAAQPAAAPPRAAAPAPPPLPKGRRSEHAAAPRARNVRARQPVPGLPLKRIVLGEWFATKDSMLVSTLLGSCVAACLFDPVAKIGGMNHFMLPKVAQPEGNSARFGVHAMEVLINELMHLGADRQRLRAMVFGAGAVNRNLSSKVAQQNGAFVRQFLAQEKIPIIAERLGGEEPREVVLRTDTGEAFVRRVKAQKAVQLQKTELAAYSQPVKQPDTFNPDDALF